MGFQLVSKLVTLNGVMAM